MKFETKITEIMPPSYPAFTCWKLTIETLEQDAKYVQSSQYAIAMQYAIGWALICNDTLVISCFIIEAQY